MSDEPKELTEADIYAIWGLCQDMGIAAPANLVRGDEHVVKAHRTLTVNVWLKLLSGRTPAEVMGAVEAYLADPALCSFWPKPGNLIGLMGGGKKQVDPDEAAWDAITERVRIPGRYRATDGSGMVAMGDLLDDRQMRAFKSIGGSRAIGACVNEWQTKELRTRFLRACQGTVTQLRVVS